jgi:hypothetical protein
MTVSVRCPKRRYGVTGVCSSSNFRRYSCLYMHLNARDEFWALPACLVFKNYINYSNLGNHTEGMVRWGRVAGRLCWITGYHGGNTKLWRPRFGCTWCLCSGQTSRPWRKGPSRRRNSGVHFPFLLSALSPLYFPPFFTLQGNRLSLARSPSYYPHNTNVQCWC